MAFFSQDMPAPRPGIDDRPFWDACDRGHLTFQRCTGCGRTRHPPSPVCSACHSFGSDWIETAGIGSVHTYTVVHHASHEAVADRLPYVVAVVTFDDVPGVRLVTNLTGIDPARVRIGLRVRVWWDEIGEGHRIPRVEPDSS